jgi:uncharacterized protein (TIGR00255 family)
MSAPPIQSMTGFGHAEHTLPQGSLRAEIRTVNHRFLNLQVRLPLGWEAMQSGVDRLIRQRLKRGHVSVTISRVRSTDASDSQTEVLTPVDVDLARARGYWQALQTLQEAIGLPDPPVLRDLLTFRDLIRVVDTPEDLAPISLEAVEELVGQALEQVVQMRFEEGQRLAQDLLARAQVLRDGLSRIEAMAPDRLIRERDRLREAIGKLLGQDILIDEERIAREVAHLAERWDIEEELVRYRSHLQMFQDTIAAPGAEGAGKRLGFILQEILRETNTIGSKANDAAILGEVVRLKEEVERLREQVENVE